MSLQVLTDTLMVLRNCVSDTEERIRQHRYEADQLESRLTWLRAWAERLGEQCEAEQPSQEAKALAAKALHTYYTGGLDAAIEMLRAATGDPAFAGRNG